MPIATPEVYADMLDRAKAGSFAYPAINVSSSQTLNAAKASDPATMSLTVAPDKNSAPPVDTWTMPSLPASAKPRRAAFRVCEEVMLIAGYANPPDLAREIISA
jgi:hypothetical protein